MSNPSPAEIERRALDLFERLSDRPDNPRFRRRLLKNETVAVLARLAALERGHRIAVGTMPTIFPAFDDDEAHPPPERIGPFKLVAPIGSGGMGQVWQGVRDDGLYDQSVAIKLIRPHLAPVAGSRFAEERRILARLEHPNIARMIDGGVTDAGVAYFIMEYIDGQPIDAFGAALGERRQIDLLIKAADAVQFAHARLVVHADLKPSNILVDANGRVKLLDFGIARLLGQEGEGDIGLQPMTRAFASPARLAGSPPTIPDDVFALGVILRDLIGPQGDADLRAIAAKAVRESEVTRYGSVAALIADLERWRDRLPVSAQPSTVAYRAGKFIERHRLGVGATAVAMLLLAGTALVATLNYSRAERARAEADARVTDLRGVARYLLFDLQDRMEMQPRSLKLRADAAHMSQSYLDRLAKRPDANPALMLEAAEGLRRLAERQGQPGRPNLGQPDRATRNLERAASLAARVETPAAWRLSIAIRIDQARLASQVDNDFARSESYLAAAKPLLAKLGTAAGDLTGRYLLELAVLRQWQDRYPEALVLARRAAAAPAPDDPRVAALFRARMFDNLGESYAYTRLPAKAVAPYRAQLAILERAHARWPADNLTLRRLARARWALATNYLDLGTEKRETLAQLELSSREAGLIAAAEPDDADAARMLNITENARAQALAANGRMDEAVTLLAAGVARRRALHRALPAETQRARDLWISLTALGDLEAQAGQVAAACRHYDESRAGFVTLKRAGKLPPADVDYSVKLLVESIGKHCTPA